MVRPDRFLLLLFTLAGCGETESTTPPPPAPRTLPTVIIVDDGSVLASPQVYPIFFAAADADTTAHLADFVSTLGASSYWAAVTQEYGVGPLTGHPPIVIPTAPEAMIDDAGIQKWLAGRLEAADPAFPKPDKNTLFALFYPDGVTVTHPMLGESCTGFYGYHGLLERDLAQGRPPVVYAVVPRCYPAFGLDAITAAASHELIEAATDPEENAYARVDTPHRAWEVPKGGEVADLCGLMVPQESTFDPFPYAVQRSWSNAAAAAMHNPCVPALGSVYAVAAPILPDTITWSPAGLSSQTPGVVIPVGQTRTIDIEILADCDTAEP